MGPHKEVLCDLCGKQTPSKTRVNKSVRGSIKGDFFIGSSFFRECKSLFSLLLVWFAASAVSLVITPWFWPSD